MSLFKLKAKTWNIGTTETTDDDDNDVKRKKSGGTINDQCNVSLSIDRSSCQQNIKTTIIFFLRFGERKVIYWNNID